MVGDIISRLDRLRQAQKGTVGLNAGNLRRGLAENPRDTRPTLASQGIDKNLAHRLGRLVRSLMKNSSKWWPMCAMP
jgi:hypothetical protein